MIAKEPMHFDAPLSCGFKEHMLCKRERLKINKFAAIGHVTQM